MWAELEATEEAMPWYFYLAYFWGGAFLVNAVPHFVNGVSGRSFPTPFASPPGKGSSSPISPWRNRVFLRAGVCIVDNADSVTN